MGLALSFACLFFSQLLRPMMLRRMKEDVEKSLAPKEETIVEVTLVISKCSLENAKDIFKGFRFEGLLGSVVRRPDSAIHWIAIFSTFVKLAVDRYNLRLRFGIYKLKFLRSIVGSRSVVSQLFG